MEAGTGSRQHACLDQHPGMRVHQTDPLNVGAPLELLRQAFVTPQDCFFVRNHGAVPHVDVHRYRLIVTGRVQVPLELSLDELRAHFPASIVMATLQCAGHRRDELAAFRPIPGEIPWGAETIGNAVWRGVALREVLRAAAGTTFPEFGHLPSLCRGAAQGRAGWHSGLRVGFRGSPHRAGGTVK
jgi:DMSO/TMAO reductase YedYZ molybdopterin-dependent catalytic subunit